MAEKSNIVLIGMCGVGKSTVGVLLAKAMGRYFIDTDVYLQAIEGRSLQDMIDDMGMEGFCDVEERYIRRIDVRGAVVATGGSVVYRDAAMKHLSQMGLVVHLDLDFDSIEKRVTNLYKRGVVMDRQQSLRGLFEKRQPIYRRYAEVTIDCKGKNHDQIVEEIISGRVDRV